MPQNYQLPTDRPVKRPTGVLIDSSWPDMFDGLVNIIGGGGSNRTYWVGGGGTVTYPLTCTGWTSNSSEVTGRFGRADNTSTSWYRASNWTCNAQEALLCACW